MAFNIYPIHCIVLYNVGAMHSGKIRHLTWTFTKKDWAVLGCTGLYWAVLGHLRYLLGNVQVKWRILPLCIAPTLYNTIQ